MPPKLETFLFSGSLTYRDISRPLYAAFSHVCGEGVDRDAHKKPDLCRVFKFGKAEEPKAPSAAPKTTEVGATAKPQPRPPVQRPYTIGFGFYATNLFNRTNKGAPIGNMASPYFLKSPSDSNMFSFGPGGGSGGNRIISVRVRFSF